ncbi:MAG TPA: DUF6364 family protein [Vicinamibacteria bacterium]|jgi:hypothetical protein
MQSKLTLRVDEKMVRRAKAYAKRTKRSVSQMVADYFALLGSRAAGGEAEWTPIVRSLKGSLRGAEVSEEDYRRHLEEKHL